MKNTIILLLLIAAHQLNGCKPEQEFENRWVGYWKLISITDNATGAVTTNPTTKEVITVFQENNQRISASSGGTALLGEYTLDRKKGKISITMQRVDEGGWPNGPWVDAYLSGMNDAQSYSIASNGQSMSITTNGNQTLYFEKP